jgi:hypothetical protein
MYFLLGGHNLHNSDAQKRTLSSFLTHPSWDPSSNSYDADIAIAILSTPIEYTDYILPACIYPPQSNDIDIIGKFGRIVGWGITESGVTSEEDPKALNILVVSDSECLRSNPVYAAITSNRTFCAGNKDGSGPCNGRKFQ